MDRVDWSCLVRAHFASFHSASGDSDACSIRSLCALRSAFLIVLALWFLAARYASHVSSVWCRLCAIFSRCLSEHRSAFFSPSLACVGGGKSFGHCLVYRVLDCCGHLSCVGVERCLCEWPSKGRQRAPQRSRRQFLVQSFSVLFSLSAASSRDVAL